MILRQNQTIHTKQDVLKQWRKFYQQPEAKEARFWSKIWKRKDHKKKAEWINNLETRLRTLEESPKVSIHADELKSTLTKISNWKTPGLDSTLGFWFKKFTSIHGRLDTKMNKCIQKIDIPEWTTKVKNTLIQKDPRLKGTALNNYRPITWLPMMWKILTAQIRGIFYSLISRGIFPNGQKGFRKRTKGTGEQLYINQHILKESKTRQKNL